LRGATRCDAHESDAAIGIRAAGRARRDAQRLVFSRRSAPEQAVGSGNARRSIATIVGRSAGLAWLAAIGPEAKAAWDSEGVELADPRHSGRRAAVVATTGRVGAHRALVMAAISLRGAAGGIAAVSDLRTRYELAGDVACSRKAGTGRAAAVFVPAAGVADQMAAARWLAHFHSRAWVGCAEETAAIIASVTNHPGDSSAAIAHDRGPRCARAERRKRSDVTNPAATVFRSGARVAALNAERAVSAITVQTVVRAALELPQTAVADRLASRIERHAVAHVAIAAAARTARGTRFAIGCAGGAGASAIDTPHRAAIAVGRARAAGWQSAPCSPGTCARIDAHRPGGTSRGAPRSAGPCFQSFAAPATECEDDRQKPSRSAPQDDPP
jgi:hypothetical protein